MLKSRYVFRGALSLAFLALVACDSATESNADSNGDSGQSVVKTEDLRNPSSSANSLSSSAEDLSSSAITSSSSNLSGLESSSSLPEGSALIESAAHCFEPWLGSDGIERIHTGYDNGSGTSGYWYTYSDELDGGESKIIWPIPPGNEYSEYSFAPVIDYCSGLCGTYYLYKGGLSYDPYAAVAFNLAGSDGYDEPSAVDASAMGGIIVTYTSNDDIFVELGLGDAMSEKLGFDLPTAKLPKATVQSKKSLTWNQFVQAGWGPRALSGEEAAKVLKSIRFKIQGKDGVTGDFNIMGVEAYNPGDCSRYVPPPKSSSSSAAPVSSSSLAPCNFDYWYGSDGIAQVSTGYDAGFENSGYWYILNDSLDGGKSSVKWRVEPDADGDLTPVVDQCGGICGSFELDKGILEYDPFVEIAFDLAGTDADGRVIPVDASGMKGISITYSSTMAATLELSLGEEEDARLGYALPAVDLPKFATGTHKDFPWEKFVQPSWAQVKISMDEAVTKIASIRFKIQGRTGSSGQFNIMGIGPVYQGWYAGPAAR